MKQILGLIMLLILAAGRVEAKLLELSHFVLSNGLEVAVVENHKAPVVLQMLYYKTGSADDPKGKGGIAHLLEHLMFRGTKNVSGQLFNRLTDEHGAQNNAYTTYNETAYYEFSDISKLELMMALEADRMTGLVIEEDDFLKERDIVLEERMQRFESQPAPLFYENLNKILWQDHPLANPVSGSPSEIKALTSDDARDFYRRFYRPDNALLVLGGDITVKEARDLAQKYYGAIPPTGQREPRSVPQGRTAETLISMQLDGVTQPRFVLQQKLDGGMYSKQDILALELLADYLAGDDTAYLYDKLVYEKKLLLSVSANVSYDAELGGIFSFSAVPADQTMSATDIRDLLKKTVKEAVAVLDEDKLTKIKNETLSDAVYLQEDPTDAAKFVGEMLLQGYTPEEISTYDEAVTGVQVADLLKVWRELQHKGSIICGYLAGKDIVEETADEKN